VNIYGDQKTGPKEAGPEALPKLSETDDDLLWHMDHGARHLPIAIRLRHCRNGGLITQDKSRDPLKIVWRTRSSRT
jgi:hypothetical protein